MDLEEAKELLEEDLQDEKQQKNFWKIIEEFELENHDGYKIIENINKFKILDRIILKPYHRKLIPLLLLSETVQQMNSKKRKLK